MGLLEGFIKSTSMILVSEIGDKTFFVAALMAMRYSRRTVFLGCHSALVVMTVFSAFFGWAAPNLIPRSWTHYAATALFFIFGFRSLYDGFTHEGGESAELAEVEAHLEAEDKRDDDATSKSQKGKPGKKQPIGGLHRLFSPVLLEAFTLTFLGEWGDRSQIATIGLAAQEDVLGVTLGGILGHGVCTGAAVVGGKHLASSISEKTVAICGGVLFLLFGVHALMTGAEAQAYLSILLSLQIMYCMTTNLPFLATIAIENIQQIESLWVHSFIRTISVWLVVYTSKVD